MSRVVDRPDFHEEWHLSTDEADELRSILDLAAHLMDYGAIFGQNPPKTVALFHGLGLHRLCGKECLEPKPPSGNYIPRPHR